MKRLLWPVAFCLLSCARSAPQPAPVMAFSTPIADTTVALHQTVASTVDTLILWKTHIPHKRIATVCAYVYDGDTIKTSDGIAVRFLGINCPEIAHPDRGESQPEPFGNDARDYLLRTLKGREITLIVPDEEPTDRYGRTLALVLSDSKVINVELVRLGLAKTYFLDNRAIINEQAWYEIQDNARKASAGIWSLP
ncbi:MAG: thermonuclease family protein [Candidatus Hydrogenedentota bacterium]